MVIVTVSGVTLLNLLGGMNETSEPIRENGRKIPPGRTDELDFPKLLGLFSHRHTSQLFSRQASALQKVVRVCEPKGLRMSYLEPIQQMIKFALASIDTADGELFIEPLSGLIRLHGKAFDTVRAFEALDSAHVLSVSLQVIGLALKSKNPAIIISIAQMLSDFVNTNQETSTLTCRLHDEPRAPRTAIADAVVSDAGDELTTRLNVAAAPLTPIDLSKAPPGELRYFIVAHSGLIPLVLDCLQKNSDNAEIALALTSTCRDFSYALITSTQLTVAGLFDIASLLLDNDARSAIINVLIELIWNLIELDPNAVAAFGTEVNVRSLSRLLQQTLSNGYRNQDKYLRNEILVILNLIARVPANRKHLARTPTLRTLLLYSTFAELDDLYSNNNPYSNRNPPMCAPFTQSTDHNDLEMKILMWIVSAMCISEQFSHSQIVQAEILRALMMYVDEEAIKTHPAVSRWSFTQLIALQKQALQVLFQIVSKLPQQYAYENGNEKLICFAETIVQNTESSVEKQLAKQELYELQAVAVSVVLQASWAVDFASQDQSSHTFSVLIGLYTSKEVTLAVKADAIAILCYLTKANEKNRRLFRKEGGLKAVVDLLRVRETVRMCVKQEPRLLYSSVDCIWQTVIGNKRNEAHFLVQDGMDCLLDLLYGNPPPNMKRQIIGCIADLLQNPKAKKYVHEWRAGPDPKPNVVTEEETALSVLLDLWTQQEEAASDKGVLGIVMKTDKDKQIPIKKQRMTTPPVFDEPPGKNSNKKSSTVSSGLNSMDSTSKSIGDDASSSVRVSNKKFSSKIHSSVDEPASDVRTALYSVLSGLGFDQLTYATPLQKAKLKKIEGYVAFRRGQVLYDIGRELLDEEDIIPTPEDQRFLAWAVEHCQRMAEDVKLYEHTEKTKVKEADNEIMDKYFETIRRRADQAKSVPVGNNTRSNFSMMRNRLAAKEMREDMLRTSLDQAATLKKTAGSGARAARNLRNGGGVFSDSAGDENDSGDKENDDDDLDDPEFEAHLLNDLRLQGLAEDYPDGGVSDRMASTSHSFTYPSDKPDSPPPLFDPRPDTQGVVYLQESILEDDTMSRLADTAFLSGTSTPNGVSGYTSTAHTGQLPSVSEGL